MLRNKRRFTAPVALTVLLILSLLTLTPLVLLVSSSLSNNGAVIREGYSLWPRDFDLTAYTYLWEQSSVILRSIGVSLLVTALGTALSLTVTALLAWPLSRRALPGRKLFSFLVVFTLLFNGGLVPTYLIYTQVLPVKDSLLALLIPNLLVSGFNVIIMRTFFSTTIPEALVEAATIDGAGEFRILTRVVLPLSLPVLTTVGLLQAMAYWNDWFNAMLYISEPGWLSLQAVLNQMINNINFLSSMGSGMGGMAAQTALPSTTVRMAMAVIGVLPFLVIYPFTQRFFVRGITIGAVKG